MTDARRRLALSLASSLLAAGCTHAPNPSLQPPVIDMTPLGCGYKWFQSAYSPPARTACGPARPAPERACYDDARAEGWRIAEKRCPQACRPVILPDPTTKPDQAQKSVCRDGYAYCTVRLFFQCGQ